MKECVQTTFADLFEHIPVLNTNEVYSQINTVAKAYINDKNFGSLGNDISMWKLYNLLTGANKSSYIDSFLDRAVNATEIATGINAALHGDTKYKWFID